MRKTIFVVDDNDTNLSKAEESLEDIYDVMTIPSGARLFAILKKIKPNLILLDIAMPEMDGFQVLEILKAEKDYKDIPVIFLTGLSDPDVESRGFDSGVVDFIAKPFSTPVLLNRVKLHIDINQLVREQTKKLEMNHQNMISILAEVVEDRDSGTGGHITRTTEYVKVLLREMQEQGLYADEINGWDLEMVGISATLHDVGKIAVSDTILNKPGKLTDEEFDHIKNHASKGAAIIDRVIKRTAVGDDDEFLLHARAFAVAHHERWDGSGYPYGLKELEIPIEGRIMAVADVYDALISERPYKPVFPHEKAVAIIMKDAGRHFDPKIAEIFNEIHETFRSVQMTIRDIKH
ncbi:MAG: response regulator [Defluviitaleaceae bacterium]|nr:response regulator [Defluviitaleaceae bacterium]